MGLHRVSSLCLIVVVAFAVLRETVADSHINVQGTINVNLVGNKKEERNVWEDRLVKGLIYYGKTGKVTKQLKKDLRKIRAPKKRFNEIGYFFKYLKETSVCIACRAAAKVLLTFNPKFMVSPILKLMCSEYVSKNVCNGLIDLNIDILIYIFKKKANLTAKKICSIIGQAYKCRNTKSGDEWNVYLPPKAKSYNPVKPKSVANEKPFRILHITDMHYDYKYIAGGNTDCGEPVCCGDDQGKPEHPTDAAGVWGDYRSCDVPLYAVENLMDAASKHDVDFIYHTGDVVNHRIWQTTRASNSKSILDVNKLFRTKFLNKAIHHIAGNHEPSPLNQWLLYNNDDPYGQLQWLSNILYQVELDEEVVHILTHVPSGDKECYKKWSHEYNRIIQRYASIIKAQFVGHTHFNELHFFYEENKEDPINVAFNGGSVTTFIDVNPNFRIYEVHPSTYQVEDYEDWIYNVTEANQHDRSVPPKWYKLYSFKKAYGLPSMDLPELGKFVRTLSTNMNSLNTYYILKVRDGDTSIKKGCDNECKEEQMCNLVTSEFGSTQKCDKILKAYKQATQDS